MRCWQQVAVEALPAPMGPDKSGPQSPRSSSLRWHQRWQGVGPARAAGLALHYPMTVSLIKAHKVTKNMRTLRHSHRGRLAKFLWDMILEVYGFASCQQRTMLLFMVSKDEKALNHVVCLFTFHVLDTLEELPSPDSAQPDLPGLSVPAAAAAPRCLQRCASCRRLHHTTEAQGAGLRVARVADWASRTLSSRRQWRHELSICESLRRAGGFRKAFRKPPPCRRLSEGLVHQWTASQLVHQVALRYLRLKRPKHEFASSSPQILGSGSCAGLPKALGAAACKPRGKEHGEEAPEAQYGGGEGGRAPAQPQPSPQPDLGQ
ncbi:hypothetical protein QTO34_016781 [Cnephaeus nilssonii]|uniref:Large ribosomal subunit protein eL36 n=1 Tax=Cnephaeus nilssonii TaxID=3371016 RepID=A0AA40LS72_CNENI|nr:hypothetical protein QTO34_016781 [Eptesicus nilssonii]